MQSCQPRGSSSSERLKTVNLAELRDLEYETDADVPHHAILFTIGLTQDEHHSASAFMNSLTRYAVPFYSIMRLVVGLMFFCHGAQKIFGWFALPGQHSGPLPPLMVTGGGIEIAGGPLISVRLCIRVAAF